MKNIFIKIIILIIFISNITGCADIQNNLQASIDSINNALNTTSENQPTSQNNRPDGKITLEQCESMMGRSQSDIEKILGFTLNAANAYTYTSFNHTYNLEIKGVQGRHGIGFGVCSVMINPESRTVVSYSILM